jgi:hypothetical protein
VQQPSTQESAVHAFPSLHVVPSAQQVTPGGQCGLDPQQPLGPQASSVQALPSLQAVPSAQQTEPLGQCGLDPQQPLGPQASSVQALPSSQTVPSAQQTSPGQRGVFPQHESIQVGTKQALGTPQSSALVQSGSKVQLPGAVAVPLTQTFSVQALLSSHCRIMVAAPKPTKFGTEEQPEHGGAPQPLQLSRMRTLAWSNNGSGSPG